MLKEAISSVLVDRLPHNLAVALSSLAESWSKVSIPWMLGGAVHYLCKKLNWIACLGTLIFMRIFMLQSSSMRTPGYEYRSTAG